MLPILRTSVPSLVDQFFGHDLMSDLFDDRITGITTPAVNIYESKEDYRIEVAAPGLTKDDFEIELDNKLLTISCEKEQKDDKKDSDNKIVRREFSYSCFKRTFVLPSSADSDKIEASHKDGILIINIPKKEEAKLKPTRKIKIS
ncbi:MAG TPA: Hsp20/alpha crystallin family protein [Bacteroidales bacterium]|nr:Hsp20/alpha crystallin family protein [Bacteroidales bacterium]